MIGILPPEWSLHSRFLHIFPQSSGSSDFQATEAQELSNVEWVLFCPRYGDQPSQRGLIADAFISYE